ncbi:cryptochrome/photolyase family protein [Lichenicola cladoniae]|uniref:Cryptochrome/photolyase family protein n=2 Tax=Lichenicola cladoniae TaxID=1484109 RepID=A0A6M8HWE1_9PROT|nr:cryptochrome/photolyase family protein [Acetobacteraceae bacterium]QKE92620.1 cryptochrome/photolyase family protein [Lichenicola cladoniae]
MVLGDQLSDPLSALDGIDPARDVVLMAEVRAECTYVRHHKKKLVLVLSGMRHFAERLRQRGIRVDYIEFENPANTHTLRGEMLRAVERHRPERVLATLAGEFRITEDMSGWQQASGIATELLDDTRYLCGLRQFRHWADGRKSLRMEFFYREMRRRHAILMDGDQPAGGRWNYDAQNRKRMPAGIVPPVAPSFAPDRVTEAVIALVERNFGDHFGTVDAFSLPVTAEQAALALDHFVTERLSGFGDWQDFMRSGDPVLFHALVSTSLNLGLLDPLTICRAAERAWTEGLAPLNAVEGFIRQVLGWREYVRGIYWLNMPEYGRRNALEATRRLPEFYWTGQTRMNCMAQVVDDTRRNAYAHHIQRLMITGNFALLAGLDPDQVDEWYLIVYADAYEWVEMPNVRGMALFADGGIMGSKPYAASGAYINRMSDYCAPCAYDPKQSTGPQACPFNALYWDFMARHADRLGGNVRMAMPLQTLKKMEPGKVAALRAQTAGFLEAMDRGEVV